MKIYREIMRNVVMAIQAVDNLSPYVEDNKLKELMQSQKTTLNEYLSSAKAELTCEEQDKANGTKLQKTMLKAGVAMNAMFNGDSTHVADMLIEGYDMGANSLIKCANELKRSGTEVPPLYDEVVKFYDKCVKALRAYL